MLLKGISGTNEHVNKFWGSVGDDLASVIELMEPLLPKFNFYYMLQKFFTHTCINMGSQAFAFYLKKKNRCMCMHACVPTVFYYKHSNFKKEIPIPLEIPFKSFKGDLWGLSLCQAPCFPHKDSREGHISYNVPALNGVSNSSRKTHSSPLDS